MMENNQKDVEKTSSEQQQEELEVNSSEHTEATSEVSSGQPAASVNVSSEASDKAVKTSSATSGEPAKVSSESSAETTKASSESSVKTEKASSESSGETTKASSESSAETTKASSESSSETSQTSPDSSTASSEQSASDKSSASAGTAKTTKTSTGQTKTAAGTATKRTTARRTASTQRTTSTQRNSSAQKTSTQRTSSRANARRTAAAGAAAKKASTSKEEEEVKAAAERIKKNSNDVKMTISGHLKELRNRVAICFIVLVVAFLIALYFSQPLINFLTDMGTKYNYVFVYISPQELLMEQFSISLVVAICVTLPLILYQVWAFVQPALKKRENTMFKAALVSGLFCFVIGVLFAYFIMLPFMLEFLIGLSEGTNIQASISVQNYINFEITIFVVMGAVFEMPVLFVILTQVGLLKVEWLRKGFKYAIIVIFLIAALVTPPDIVSQSMVAIPMIGLYWISILISTLLLKFRKPKEENDDDDDDDDDDG